MKVKHMMLILGTVMAVTLAGCGFSDSVAEVTPTPAATPTPTEVPVTVTPVPTSTPAPKVIGVKTSQAKYIYLTNKLQDNIREIYLMKSGGEEWGKNLIPSESMVKAAEQVQMFYTADSTSTENVSDSSESTEESADTTTAVLYDMKIVTAKGDAYQIYSIDLGDMEKADLSYDEEISSAYLSYTSLSDKSEKNTKDNSQQTVSADDSDAASYSSDDSSYDDSGYDDSSYDDGSYDDGSYDDGSYDDGSYDDGSYDDGSYDDGDYDDNDYEDEGNDSDSYDESSDDWDY